MPVDASSLSVAVQGVRDFLADHFGEDVRVTVMSPQRASEGLRGANQRVNLLNIFVYRVAPSGFHAAQSINETQFIRINALLTPFPHEDEAEDTDLRILGHAVRVLNCHPVLPPDGATLPGAALTEPPGRREYRLQAMMQAPPMEELNHIWTTQGAELAYRLSASYEFSLIPIEPLEERLPAAPPRTAILGAEASAEVPAGMLPVTANTVAIPLADNAGGPPPTTWLPVQMLVAADGTLTSELSVAASATDVTLALAGPAGEAAAVEVEWMLAGNAPPETQGAQVFAFGAPLIDNPAARVTLALSIPATAESAVLRTRPAAAGVPVADSPFANALTLRVTP